MDVQSAMYVVQRLVLGILGFGLIGAYLWWKWKRAGEASDAMDLERQAAKQTFEQLKRDPRFLTLHQWLSAKYRAATTFDAPADRATFRICYIGLATSGCSCTTVLMPDIWWPIYNVASPLRMFRRPWISPPGSATTWQSGRWDGTA